MQVKSPFLGGQGGKEIIKSEKMHASLFRIKTRIADNVKKYFIELDAKSNMLKEYKCFLPAVLFFSLVQLRAIEKEHVGTDNADMESRQKKRKHT